MDSELHYYGLHENGMYYCLFANLERAKAWVASEPNSALVYHEDEDYFSSIVNPNLYIVPVDANWQIWQGLPIL